MINPVITNTSKEMIIWEETCISLPNCTGMVKRHKSIQVEFLDIKGKKQKQKYKDFNAVIIQHEIDHMDGKLILDQLSHSQLRHYFNYQSQWPDQSAPPWYWAYPQPHTNVIH